MELIVVEWDPPKTAPNLRNAAKWPDLLQDVTIITVDSNSAKKSGCRYMNTCMRMHTRVHTSYACINVNSS